MIWTYDTERTTVRPSRIEETGAQTNFYSIQLEDGSYNDDLDEWLRTVEDRAGGPYEQLLSGKIPTGQERADFSTFVASLFARSPALIRANAIGFAHFLQRYMDMNWSSRERFDAFMDKLEAETGRINEDRDGLFKFWGDKDRFTIAISQKRGLRALAVSDELAEIMYGRWWYLLDAMGGFFITSDSPVFRMTPEDRWHPTYGDGGFKNPFAEVTVPLSPRRMLLITGQRLSVERFLVPEEQVWALNGARALGAERFLYAHVKDERIKQLGLEHRGGGDRFHVSGGPFSEVKVTR